MKTAIVLSGQVLGIIEDEINVGEIIQLESNGEKTLPFVINNIIPMPKLVSPDNPDKLVNWLGLDAEQVAYLHYDEKNSQKFTQKKTSQKLEKILAQNLGGKTTPGSGAFGFHKGDVISDVWLAEHKYTDKTSYRLNFKTWDKIEQEAFGRNKLPLMEIVINQSTDPIKIIILKVFDFLEATNANEDEFNELFLCDILSEASKSVLLKFNEIQEYFEDVRSNCADKIPGIIFTNNRNLLFGIETQDFIRIFND